MEYFVQTPHQLGQITRGVRKAKGLTQEEVASQVGLRQKAVSLFETDPAHTTVERFFKMLSALRLEVVLREKEPLPSDASELEW